MAMMCPSVMSGLVACPACDEVIKVEIKMTPSKYTADRLYVMLSFDTTNALKLHVATHVPVKKPVSA